MKMKQCVGLGLLTCVVLVLLAGCSGGGGSSPSVPLPIDPPVEEDYQGSPEPDELGTAPPAKPTATGRGVRVGIVDSGLTPELPDFFDYDAVTFRSFSEPDRPGLNDNGESSKIPHGTWVALALAGQPGELCGGEYCYEGGLAYASELYIAQASRNNQFDRDPVFSALQWLVGQRAAIINMSFGPDTTYATDLELRLARQVRENQVYYQSFQQIAGAGGLMVFAAGNHGLSHASSYTQLPLVFNDRGVQNHSLVVTGTYPISDSSYETHTGDQHPDLNIFNACGNTAEYCLTAPGYVDYPYRDQAAVDWSVERGRGTSFAAPRVSAAAALVKEVFPWMDGHNLQQTLLTTARYRSDAFRQRIRSWYDENGQFQSEYKEHEDTARGRPFNDTFGWGDLDSNKALGGPASFYAGDFTANLSTGAYAFSNDISGDGGLVVAGGVNAGGVLWLSGDNTYEGATRVKSNTLAISGSIRSNTEVLPTGNLTGTGRIIGNVHNAGGLLTLSSGALQIQGDYSQTATGLLHILLDNPLQVDGNAQLDGRLKVSLPDQKYILKSSEQLLHAAQGISGRFASIDLGPFLSGDVSYGEQEVTGAFSRVDTLAAITANGLQDAALLKTAANVETAMQVADRWSTLQTANSQQQSLLASAAAFQQLADINSAAVALQSLSGQAHSTSNALLLNSQDYQSQLVHNQLNQRAENSRQGFWLEAGQLEGSLDRSGYLGSDYVLDLTWLGADSHWGVDGLRAGAAYSYGRLRADYAGLGGRSVNNLQGVTLYGRYAVTPEWFIQGSLGYQRGKDQLQRSVLLNAVTAVSSETRSDAWQGLLKTGYLLRWGSGFDLTPYAGLKSSHLSIDGFHDQGSDFGLLGESSDYRRSLALAGLDWQLRQGLGTSWWWALQLRAEYQLAFRNPSLDARARWVGLGEAGQTFEVPGITLDRRTQEFGARLTLGGSSNVRYFIQADNKRADSGNERLLRAGLGIDF